MRTRNARVMADTSGPEIVDFANFAKLDIRAGTIVAVEPFARARVPAYMLTVDFGTAIGTRRSSAQIVANYTPETLVGRRVFAVVNFAPKRIAGFASEVLVLGAPDAAGNVVLAVPERDVSDGAKLF